MRSPWLELVVLTSTVVLSYLSLYLITCEAEIPAGGMTLARIALLLLGFFLLSFAIAVIAVLAGIGGGVIYTPILLAFTPVHSLIVRANGLIVTMFSGLVSSGPFLKRGVGNLKLSILLNVGYGIGGFAGAQGAVWVSRHMGAAGEGVVRLCLGALVLALGVFFLVGGAKMEWPQVRRVDRFSRWLRLANPYYEPSLDRWVDYLVTRVGWGMASMAGIGMISGFFGMGAGWAVIPAINFIMGVPLKVAAAISGIIMGMGGCVTVWPYIYAGAVIPLLAAPWLAGQVLGGILGAHVLIRSRSESIRSILIGILFYTSFGLVTNGFRRLGVMGAIPGAANVGVLVAMLAAVTIAILRRSAGLRRTNPT